MAAKKTKTKKSAPKKAEPRKAARKSPSRKPVQTKPRKAQKIAAKASSGKSAARGKAVAAKKGAAKKPIVRAKAAPKKAAPKKAAPKKAVVHAKAAPKKAPARAKAPVTGKAARPTATTQGSPTPSGVPKGRRREKKPILVRHDSTPSNGVRRRDRAGHLDPKYAADLHEKSLEGRDASDEVEAFVHGSHTRDDLAEELGEEAVETMTSGEDDGGEARDKVVDEELGGPFVQSSEKDEFGDDPDESNPSDATREPFPKT